MISPDNVPGQLIPIYIGTVCLERNRWGSKEPSFKVSEWADRFKADGLDGIELWENHYLRADKAEQKALGDGVLPITIFNSYVGFTDEEAEDRRMAAEGIQTLQAPALKYNLGHDNDKTDEYRRNLLAWAELLPSDCRLICECHQGTVLETIKAASEFHAELDPENEILPAAGVYAGRFLFLDDGNPERGVELPAVMNVGTRPTFEGDGRLQAEAHLLDFKGDVYGRRVEMSFLARLREERRFADVDALREQIAADIGDLTATVKEFAVDVIDNSLEIEFTHLVENPKISAIEIIETGGDSGKRGFLIQASRHQQ